MANPPHFGLTIVLFAVGACASWGQAQESPDRPWALRPIERPALPVRGSDSATRNPIDAFVDAALESTGLSAGAEADRRTLIRRVTFDLIGLPPTPTEVAEFTADTRPDAYERLVDRLLASPQFGERWGRHWLDVVRFAESRGYERDEPKPNAWRYRDYVIDAVNSDKPYDRFLTEQLAGDELADASAETRIATGLHRLGLIDDEPADPVMDRFDQLDDMVKTVGTTFLGLTLHCARCHDHKFDPILQSDYYRFVSFFTPSRPFVRDSVESISLSIATASEVRRMRELKRAVDHQLESLRKRQMMVGENDSTLKTAINARIAEVEKNQPASLPLTLGLTDKGHEAEPTKLLERGDAHKPGQEVVPGFIHAIDETTPTITAPAGGKTTGRRTALARWITSETNPLTARVIVNRLWHHHLGRGIVGTPSDFGAMGETATHPELIDWLASELVARDWSLKSIHRLIVTSAAYRRASSWNDAAGDSDPDNTLLWRFTPRRLEAEPVRDAMLAVSGELNTTMHGPSVMPPIDPVVLAGQSRPGNGWTVSPPREADRRSVYVFVKRTLAVPELEVMDAACADEPVPKRPVTTTAPQSLTFMNSAFANDQAARFADRLARDAGLIADRQVELAYWLAYARAPSPEEQRDALAFLSGHAKLVATRGNVDAASASREALRAFCLMVLNSNEFLTID